MKRRLLELSVWALAIGAPLAFWQLQSLNTYGGKLLVLDEEDVALMLVQIIFFYVFPSVPFILLAYLCRRRGLKGALRHGIGSLIGATIGAFVAVGTPYLLLRYNTNFQSPIDMGILITPMPICSLIMIVIGLHLGDKLEKICQQKNDRAAPNLPQL